MIDAEENKREMGTMQKHSLKFMPKFFFFPH